MSDSKVAKRYAKALFKTLDSENLQNDEANVFLNDVEELYSHPEIGRFFTNPVMPAPVKLEALKSATNKLDSKLAKTLNSFFEVVSKAGRLAVVGEMISAYRQLLQDKKGLAKGEVTTVVTLTESDLGSLEREFSRILNRKVSLSQKQDPSLLGGFVVRIGNYLVDRSLKKRIEDLAAAATN